jgi:hypothetical protein
MRIPDHVLSWKSAGISAPGVETHVWPVRSTVQVEATDRSRHRNQNRQPMKGLPVETPW